MKHTLTLTHKKSTKGTEVYEALPTGTPPAVTSLYVQKWAFPGSPPKQILLTLETPPAADAAAAE